MNFILQGDIMDNKLSVGENELTERQKRESEYYNIYTNKLDVENVDFDPVDGIQKRPWNSYWYVYDLVRMYYNKDKNKLLDFGCGWGETSVRFAKIGYEVYGFDISEGNLKVAKKLTRKYGFQNQVEFSLQIAENLNYPSGYFDIIVGFDILHHVNIKSAILECKRILKDGGVAIFREPVEVPIIDYIRNTKIIKYIIPNEKNFNVSEHITQDERKLNKEDSEIIKNVFPDIKEEKFCFLSRFDRYFRKYYRRSSPLEIIDRKIFNIFPFFRKYGGDTVFILNKK